METVLIDTNIFIGRFRKEPRSIAALGRVQGCSLVLCDAVAAELLSGTRNRREYNALWKELSQQFHILPFTMEVSFSFREILGHHAREHGVFLADYLIAATAIAHGVPLLTLNAKHFKGVTGLKLA